MAWNKNNTPYFSRWFQMFNWGLGNTIQNKQTYAIVALMLQRRLRRLHCYLSSGRTPVVYVALVLRDRQRRPAA